MTPNQMIEHCQRQQELTGDPNCRVLFRLPGKWGKRREKRLFRYSLRLECQCLGRIIAEEPGPMVLVEFRALDVIDACRTLKLHVLQPEHGDSGP